MKPALVFIPTLHPDRGFGHLSRCVRWATERSKSFVFLADRWGKDRIQAAKDAFPDFPFFIVNDKRLPSTAIGILDCFRTTVVEFEPWKRKFKQWIVLDEGGPLRTEAPFLIDTLPNDALNLPNTKKVGLIQRQNKRPLNESTIEKILVTFGGSDPFHLTEKFISSGIWDDQERQYTLVLGPQVSRAVLIPDTLNCIRNTGTLDELMIQHNGVLCSFGLTAYEALTLGKGVFLVNGTLYHNQLSARESFPWGDFSEAQIFFQKWPEVTLRGPLERVWERLPKSPFSWEGLIDQGEWSDWSCSACSSREGEVLFRQENRTFFSCSRCGMISQMVFGLEKKTYSQDYFFQEYQEQYGRTYLEDFDHIRSLGDQRIKHMKPMLPKGGKILEIGCAYGPFIQAAKDRGFEALGTDINSGAIEYITKELGFQGIRGDFLQIPLEVLGGAASYDAVCLWYVIEHFPQVFKLLEKVKKLLKPGGILAFSTPNARGGTGRWDPWRFYTSSPQDHYTLWSPENSRKVLDRFGFGVLSMRHTGIHPERIPWAKSSFLRGIMASISPLFGLGDTFEVYARLER